MRAPNNPPDLKRLPSGSGRLLLSDSSAAKSGVQYQWYCGHCHYGPHSPEHHVHCSICGRRADALAKVEVDLQQIYHSTAPRPCSRRSSRSSVINPVQNIFHDVQHHQHGLPRPSPVTFPGSNGDQRSGSVGQDCEVGTPTQRDIGKSTLSTSPKHLAQATTLPPGVSKPSNIDGQLFTATYDGEDHPSGIKRSTPDELLRAIAGTKYDPIKAYFSDRNDPWNYQLAAYAMGVTRPGEHVFSAVTLEPTTIPRRRPYSPTRRQQVKDRRHKGACTDCRKKKRACHHNHDNTSISDSQSNVSNLTSVTHSSRGSRPGTASNVQPMLQRARNQGGSLTALSTENSTEQSPQTRLDRQDQRSTWAVSRVPPFDGVASRQILRPKPRGLPRNDTLSTNENTPQVAAEYIQIPMQQQLRPVGGASPGNARETSLGPSAQVRTPDYTERVTNLRPQQRTSPHTSHLQSDRNALQLATRYSSVPRRHQLHQIDNTLLGSSDALVRAMHYENQQGNSYSDMLELDERLRFSSRGEPAPDFLGEQYLREPDILGLPENELMNPNSSPLQSTNFPYASPPTMQATSQPHRLQNPFGPPRSQHVANGSVSDLSHLRESFSLDTSYPWPNDTLERDVHISGNLGDELSLYGPIRSNIEFEQGFDDIDTFLDSLDSPSHSGFTPSSKES